MRNTNFAMGMGMMMFIAELARRNAMADALMARQLIAELESANNDSDLEEVDVDEFDIEPEEEEVEVTESRHLDNVQERMSALLEESGCVPTEPRELQADDLVLSKEEYTKLVDHVDDIKNREELDEDWLARHDENVRKECKAELKAKINGIL